MSMQEKIDAACQTFRGLVAHEAVVADASRAIVEALRTGHRILSCGNGGSAAEAMHLSTELTGRYKADRISLPAIFLGADSSLVTCIANDYGWDEIFARALKGNARHGDILVAFTTSGNSQNVVRALETAREMAVASVALLGKGGGACRGLATWEVIIDSPETERIQEAHQFLLHVMCDAVEAAFVPQRARA
ncbi:MAG: SIS domain-containing protein [Armatimonadetes bacterium]|nr:SIS domain-containing protein [Armatimonadota bacterium]